MQGYVTHDGVRIGYRVYGDEGRENVVLMPAGTIVDSRHWKAQVPYLSRHFRVVTFDPPGNGRSERPLTPAAYSDDAQVGQLFAVMDAAGMDRAVLGGLCSGAWRAFAAAARQPDRVTGVIAISPLAPFLGPPLPERAVYPFHGDLGTDEGWAKYNREFWLRDWPAFARFFFGTVVSDPHSSRQAEEAISWALQTTGEVMVVSEEAPSCVDDRAGAEALLTSVECPVLVIRPTGDRCRPQAQMRSIAELTRAREVVLEGAGHLPHTRFPVHVNHLMRDFIAPRPVRRTVGRGRKRILYVSSPIGLGHVERDVAIVDELRRTHDVEVDWLAQHPITEVLRRRSERVHPASDLLQSEAAHVDAEAGVHDLHAFQAVRRMDEILVANFMVFADLVERERYDLWAGDEAWELDHFLYENPGLKRAPYAWLTDFVGWLPMPSGGAAEAALTADYNAEMVEHVAAHPGLRDRAIFVGNPDDLVDDPLGPGLPTIRDWTTAHFDFTGYVRPTSLVEKDDPDLCVVTAGGSGTGEDLLRMAIAAFPAARARRPRLRMLVVAGPRIDPASFAPQEGLEIRGYVDRLDQILAGCGLAVTHGGLTTTMTLTAHHRPFLYVPLRNHFEQNRHVRHRLANYGAGRCLDWTALTPQSLADAIVAEIGRPVRYRPVETDGAERAAAMLAELL